jgi:hypothetical protein
MHDPCLDNGASSLEADPASAIQRFIIDLAVAEAETYMSCKPRKAKSFSIKL